MAERDFDMDPYSEAEERVTEFFIEAGVGGGDDPIGGLIASHRYAMSEIARLKEELAAKVVALQKIAAADAPPGEWHINGVYVGRIARAALD